MGNAGHNPSWPEEHWVLSRDSSRQGTLLSRGPVSCEGPIHLWLSLHPLRRTAQPRRPLSAAVALSDGVGSEPGCWGQGQGHGPESPYSPKSLEHICSMRPSALSSISHWAQILVTAERESRVGGIPKSRSGTVSSNHLPPHQSCSVIPTQTMGWWQ